MRIYTTRTVYEAALARIRWLFDEFDDIYVNFSGGKDSTICLQLALIVAEERGRLPLNVVFIDQEAEWQCVIDYVREVMSDPRVNPLWLQVPIILFNATSTAEPWLHCWEEGAQWIRDKEPNSIHQNVYGTNRFGEMFNAFVNHHAQGRRAISIAGVRAEESPARAMGLSTYETYKGETWGKIEDKNRQQYVFYPIYDWSYRDVWKAIHDNGWNYCALYDYMYQYGIPVKDMRVSNVHHETAVKSLFFLQEIEAETWERVTQRISGINTAGQLKGDFYAKELPWMFKDWKEYRDYLLDNLITDKEHWAIFRKRFDAHDGRYIPEVQLELNRAEVQMLLVNDYHGSKYSTFHAAHGHDSVRFRKERGLPMYGNAQKDHGYVHDSTANHNARS